MSHRRSFALVALSLLLATSVAARAAVSVGISVNIAPPALPVYEQPLIPGPGYIWVPGYWAWDGADYYWVPGTWVLPPEIGFLWTPGYWGWADGVYLWHEGYWGTDVGFYGGIDYGFGYLGTGYVGGYWSGGAFFYNRAVNRIDNVRITNVYNRTVVNEGSRVSFNGGRGGIQMQPTSRELTVEHQRHLTPVSAQVQQMQIARSDPTLHAAVNHGRPAMAATQRPGVFERHDEAPARGAPGRAGPQERVGAPERVSSAERAGAAGQEERRFAAPQSFERQPPQQRQQAPRDNGRPADRERAQFERVTPQGPPAFAQREQIQGQAPRAPQPARAEPQRAEPQRGGPQPERAQRPAPEEHGNGGRGQERRDEQGR